MNLKTVDVEKGTFRSRLIPAATVLFALSALCGLLAVGSLFHPASIPAIISDLKLSQIFDPSAQRTWLVIYIAVTAVNCVSTLVLTSGMGQVLMGRYHPGMDLMYKYAKWGGVAVNVSGVAATVYFVVRATRYIILCLSINGGLIPLMSMVIMETLMVAQAWLLFTKLRWFLECAVGTTASIGFTLTSGKLDAPAIPSFTATGFLILAFFDFGIALDRLFTFIHEQKNLSVTYGFPMATEPVQLLSGASFATAAVGSILMYIYLRNYKRTSERLLYRRVREQGDER